ncbi:VOC family protein [Sphingobacterium oryzagri]|uniref:VOC family protein n=1 Tax=Sphingobacterium oryzagri TaxID=3025669 RepID=A0ABY7WF61_9SPHI|nr:VOC family protein [Sphingobacterium sp. KACC 22765]WDF67838.1 VOC family protein [Sphingobacterium sp. KACC 22765]
MIKGIYETHIQVSNLERALAFYTKVLNLKLGHLDEARRIAFLFMPEDKSSMLGLWEQTENLQTRHFAFYCDQAFILDQAVSFLQDNGLQPYNFLKDGSIQPMVFAWMPALAIYFNDPDGNQLEFIALLTGEAKPALGVLTYGDWLAQQ